MFEFLKKAIKILKIVTRVVFIVFVVSLALFCIGRFGWKIFGLKMCENPDTVLIDTVYVTENTVSLMGNTSKSATSYVGYSYEVRNNALYVGIKQNLLLGFRGRRGDFSIRIEDYFANIKSVYISNGESHKEIWNLEKDGRYLEKIKAVRLYKSVDVTDDLDPQKAMENKWFYYASEELLEKIRKAKFSDEYYLSKGAGYLGVAEMVDGSFMFLEFEKIYTYFDIIGKYGHYGY